MRMLRGRGEDDGGLDGDLAKLAAALRADLRQQVQQLLKDPRRREVLVARVMTDVQHALTQQLSEELVREVTAGAVEAVGRAVRPEAERPAEAQETSEMAALEPGGAEPAA